MTIQILITLLLATLALDQAGIRNQKDKSGSGTFTLPRSQAESRSEMVGLLRYHTGKKTTDYPVLPVLVQFEPGFKTPQAFANSSPVVGAKRQRWVELHISYQP